MSVVQFIKEEVIISGDKQDLMAAALFLLRHPSHKGIKDPRLLSRDSVRQHIWGVLIEELQTHGLLQG